MSSKIIVKKPIATATALPKASAVPKKVVVAPSPVVAKSQKVVAPAKKPIKKVVYVEESEVEEEVEEVDEAPLSRDDMLIQALTLLQQAMGMSGRGKVKLTKSGKIRQPRGPRENSEKQTAWMEFVKQVREEQGVDENGKFLISHKDAMKLAKELRAEEAGSEHTEEDDAPAPAPTVALRNGQSAKKAVVPAKKAAAPAKKSPQEIRAEFLARSAAAAVAEEEAEASVEVEEFEHNGKTYLKNTDNLCWLTDSEGNQTWAGVYLPEEDRIDSEVEEPTA